MFLNLYRRQHRIILILVLAIILISLFCIPKNENNFEADEEFYVGNENKISKNEKKEEIKSVKRKKIRINIKNYLRPLPCVGCPGENGAAVNLTAEEGVDIDEVYKKEFFNLRASDKISLWRSLPDMRNQECKDKVYPSSLPTTSVIIIFTNERWSPLLRTVYSVLHRSPRNVLKEIILVDDKSELDELKQKLDDYCEEHFGDIVRVFHSEKRLGLIGAKNFGGRQAVGDVIVFLDAHCEATDGWLEPIVMRIKEKPNAILCPLIESIDKTNLAYLGNGGNPGWGIFTWSLFFKWGRMPDRVRSKYNIFADPYPSPTMAGGLLAADRKYFFEIGGYDDGMEVWGGENLELSFRTWMCGGSLEFVPCSHVGHIFRPGHPYNMTGEQGKGDVHGRNSMRMAEAWMDDYKRFYYHHRPNLIGSDYGDISERLEIRKRLKCHNFKWYLDNVYPEKFIPDENVQAYGHVRNQFSSLCLDTLSKSEQQRNDLGVYSCQNISSNQIFSLSHTDELRREIACCFSSGIAGSIVQIKPCEEDKNEKWTHTKNGTIIHKDSGLCLDVTGIKIGEFVKVQICEPLKSGQLWKFSNYEK